MKCVHLFVPRHHTSLACDRLVRIVCSDLSVPVRSTVLRCVLCLNFIIAACKTRIICRRLVSCRSRIFLTFCPRYNQLIIIMSYYAVRDGRSPGIYDNWSDCKDQVHQYSGSAYKKFDSRSEAEAFVRGESSGPSRSGYSGSYGSSSSYGGGSGSRSGGRSDGYTDVYTDGSCRNNGQNNPKGGVGAYFGDDHPWNVSEPLGARGRPTNNKAEIEAATRAAEQAQRGGVDRLRINTDSDLLVKTMNNYMPKWKENGWKTANNQPVKNQEELRRLDEATRNMDVQWNHVPGHKGVRGNEMADRLAREGSDRYKRY